MEKQFARILTSYYRPKPGGFCKRLFRGINALLDAGHEVHYVSVVRFPIEHANCHFHHFPWPEKHTDNLLFWGIFHLGMPIQLLYLGLKHKITHGFAFGPNYSLFLQPLRLLKRIPISLFYRADAIENHRIKKNNPWLLKLELSLESLAIHNVHIVGVSKILIDKVLARQNRVKPASISILRNDIHIETKTHIIKGKHPVRLTCAGILEPRKNQLLIIEALKDIPLELYQLNIYGVGFQKEELITKVNEYNLTKSIHFKGWVEAKEIWSNTDLLLMPSLHEGAPNSVLEALAHNIPILASDIPEHKEILQEINLLPLNNRTKWHNRINQILMNLEQELSNIRKLQKQSVKKLTFDWENKFVNAVINNDNTGNSYSD